MILPGSVYYNEDIDYINVIMYKIDKYDYKVLEYSIDDNRHWLGELNEEFLNEVCTKTI